MLFEFKNYSGFVRCVQKERERERGRGKGEGRETLLTLSFYLHCSLAIK